MQLSTLFVQAYLEVFLSLQGNLKNQYVSNVIVNILIPCRKFKLYYVWHYYPLISCYYILVRSKQPTATELDADIGSEKMEELNGLTSKFIMRSRLC